MDQRRPVAHVDFIIRRFAQRFAGRRGQALAQHDFVMFAVLQALDAKLLILGRDRGIGKPRGGYERREVGVAQGKRFGKLEARARRGGLIVDLVLENAKPMLFAEVLIDIAHLRDIGNIEARAIGIEGGTPHASLGKDFAEPGERHRLFRLGTRPLIGDIGGRRTLRLELIIVLRRDRRARIGDPGARDPWDWPRRSRQII